MGSPALANIGFPFLLLLGLLMPSCGNYSGPITAAGSYAQERSVGFTIGASGVEKKSVDLIIAVDTSGSMSEETQLVIQNLRKFHDSLNSFADTRVSLIMDSRVADRNALVISDPRERLIPVTVNSNDAPSLAMDILDSAKTLSSSIAGQTLKTFLRPGAQPVFLFVTDDDAYESNCFNIAGEPNGRCRFGFGRLEAAKYANSAISTWTRLLNGAEPIVNGIIGHRNVAVSDLPTCSTTAATGNFYIEAAKLSGGRVYSICLQDWTKLFADVAQQIRTRLNNGYALPADFASILSVSIDGVLLETGQYEITQKKLYISASALNSFTLGSSIIVKYMTP